MECQCGSEVVNSQHEVKTMKCALEWSDRVNEASLPVIIDSFECKSCTRFGFKVTGQGGNLIDRRGV
jgi:hypothetical protein